MSDAKPVILADRYRLVGLLGHGGMGRVWAARDELLGRDVAVKELLLPTGLSEAEVHELRERAIREARAIARLDHHNVVRIFDVLFADGRPWIVMELVPSRSLFAVISEDGPMSPRQAARIGLGVLAALRSAHRAGLLHRDVKPANVLLADDGRVVLTDFGLATASGDSGMTHTGIVLGSPAYLAPERALDGEIGPAADLWSLGATLYAAVEGKPPYDKSSPIATLAALATEPPRPPQQAGVLRPALEGLLQKDPSRRVTADEAESLLWSAANPPSLGYEAARFPADAGTAPAGAPSTLSPAVPGKPASHRRRWLIGAAAALVVAASVAARPLVTSALADDQPAPRTVATSSAGAATPSGRPAQPGPHASSAPSQIAPATAPPSAATSTTTPAAKPTTAGSTTTAPTATTPAAVGRQAQSMATSTCLYAPDIAGEIQLWACADSTAQKFRLPADGSLRVRGRCVQITGTGDGARLRLAACTGSAAQQFTYNTISYDLVSTQANKCVDVPDSNSANGVPAQIWECTGASNQKWRY